MSRLVTVVRATSPAGGAHHQGGVRVLSSAAAAFSSCASSSSTSCSSSSSSAAAAAKTRGPRYAGAAAPAASGSAATTGGAAAHQSFPTGTAASCCPFLSRHAEHSLATLFPFRAFCPVASNIDAAALPAVLRATTLHHQRLVGLHQQQHLQQRQQQRDRQQQIQPAAERSGQQMPIRLTLAHPALHLQHVLSPRDVPQQQQQQQRHPLQQQHEEHQVLQRQQLQQQLQQETEGTQCLSPFYYEERFAAAIAQLHAEGRYRVFAELKRKRGQFPRAAIFFEENQQLAQLLGTGVAPRRALHKDVLNGEQQQHQAQHQQQKVQQQQKVHPQQKVQQQQQKGQQQQERQQQEPQQARSLQARMRRGEVQLWCSNDYLGMGQHPLVLQAAHAALDEVGAGAGGTRNISGTSSYHVELERELAAFHGKEAALLFTSGYVANEASLTTLGQLLPQLHIFSDEKNHASIIAGIRGAKNCSKFIYRHNDLQHLRQLLQQAPAGVPKLIVCESLYSMDGSFAPLSAICDAAAEFNALTYVDEVHAVGLYGASGGGVAQQLGEQLRVDLINGTLAKAIGVFGGYIAGKATLIDCIRSYASGFIFTSSIPPAVAAAASASIRHLRASAVERCVQQVRVAQLKQLLRASGFPLFENSSHIVPVLVGCPNACKAASDLLLADHQVYIQPINYPTVPRGTERLRITPSPLHTYNDIVNLVSALKQVWKTLGLRMARDFGEWQGSEKLESTEYSTSLNSAAAATEARLSCSTATSVAVKAYPATTKISSATGGTAVASEETRAAAGARAAGGLDTEPVPSTSAAVQTATATSAATTTEAAAAPTTTAAPTAAAAAARTTTTPATAMWPIVLNAAVSFPGALQQQGAAREHVLAAAVQQCGATPAEQVALLGRQFFFSHRQPAQQREHPVDALRRKHHEQLQRLQQQREQQRQLLQPQQELRSPHVDLTQGLGVSAKEVAERRSHSNTSSNTPCHSSSINSTGPLAVARSCSNSFATPSSPLGLNESGKTVAPSAA